MRIGYIAPFILPTGYGEAARSHAKAMEIAGATVLARLSGDFSGLEHELIEDEAVRVMLGRKAPDYADESADAWVWHVTPDAAGLIAERKNLIYSVWETQGLPDGWADICNRFDAILTCSEFSASLFRQGGVEKPVLVSPHPIDTERFRPPEDGASPLRGLFPGIETLFLVVAQVMPRKGVEDVLVAFGSEFAPDEKVGLVMLVWRWAHTVKERRAVKGWSRSVLARLNKPAPKVWLLGDKLPPELLPDLYGASDVLVSASRGEALSLPIFEAAACGTPAISTGWGGMWDFLSDETAYSVGYDMETVHNMGDRWRHYNARQKWARPRLDDLRRQMRAAHEDSDGRRAKGRLAMEMVQARLNPQVTGKAMLDALQSVLDGHKTE